MKAINCELCSQEAALFCDSDSAYLCWACDAKVHQANFLVARHVRKTLCSKCKGLSGECFYGGKIEFPWHFCKSCSDVKGREQEQEEEDSLSSCSSTTCVSSTTSFAATNNKSTVVQKSLKPRTFEDKKAEGIFVNWCKRLGVNSNLVVPLAMNVIGLSLRTMGTASFRVRLAASFWLALRLCCNRKGERSVATCRSLMMVEAVSHVPAKVILAAEAKVASGLKAVKPKRQRFEEGWDESSA